MEQEIQKMNEVIYAFMEGKWQPTNKKRGGLSTYSTFYASKEACQKRCNKINKGAGVNDTYEPLPKSHGLLDTGLYYHSDWNWIMKAWIKFRDLKPQKGRVIGFYNLISEIEDVLIKARNPLQVFDKLYHAILWYNSQVKETIKAAQ